MTTSDIIFLLCFGPVLILLWLTVPLLVYAWFKALKNDQ